MTTLTFPVHLQPATASAPVYMAYTVSNFMPFQGHSLSFLFSLVVSPRFAIGPTFYWGGLNR